MLSALQLPNDLWGPVRRKPDHQGVGWAVTSYPISNTRCVHSRNSSLALAWPQFSQAHYKAASFLHIMSRGSMQQLLVNGLDPEICTQKVNIFLICLGTSLRCPGGSQGLSNEICQIARQCESEAFGCLSQRANGVIWVFPRDEHLPAASS